MADNAPLVLLVGHCGPDGFMLRNVAQRALPSARIEMADDDRALAEHLPAADVLLVNRVLDGGLRERSGVELIRRLRADGAPSAALLVSNFPEAQAEAEAAGALPGFGKRDAYADETARRIRAAAEHAARARAAAS